MRRLTATALCLAALGLGGCAATPELATRQYSLALAGPPPAPPAGPTTPVTGLRLEPVQVASYLQRMGIVYNPAANAVTVARRHRWAAPLATQLGRGLRAGLGAQLPALVLYQGGEEAPADLPRLRVEFSHFHGRYDGHALVAGTWRLLDGPGALLQQGRFDAEVVLAADGYDALVAALSDGLDQAIDDIARELRPVLGRATPEPARP